MRLWLPLAILAVFLSAAGSTQAGSLPCLDPQSCGWTLSVSDTTTGGSLLNESGTFVIDANGNVGFSANPYGSYVFTGPGFTANFDSLTGNVDPSLIFGLGGSNSGSNPITFAFALSLPLGSLAEPINSHAELGVTLTPSSSSVTANIFPTLGGGKIVDSQDLRLSPFASVDKGVDVGTAHSAIGTTQLFLEQANGSIHAGQGPYNLMSVVIAFGLTPGSAAGLSGRVEQQTPEPGLALLVGAGVLGLAISRRVRG